MAEQTRTGRCECGAVTFTADVEKDEIAACHCGRCRRMAAGPFLALDCKNLVFAEGAPVSTYPSSDWANRTFCTVCGTILAWVSVDGNFIEVNAYVFDEAPKGPLTTEIFVDDKPEHYAFAGETTKMTGAEVFALAQSQ